jgi:hypothetical protein
MTLTARSPVDVGETFLYLRLAADTALTATLRNAGESGSLVKIKRNLVEASWAAPFVRISHIGGDGERTTLDWRPVMNNQLYYIQAWVDGNDTQRLSQILASIIADVHKAQGELTDGLGRVIDSRFVRELPRSIDATGGVARLQGGVEVELDTQTPPY